MENKKSFKKRLTALLITVLIVCSTMTVFAQRETVPDNPKEQGKSIVSEPEKIIKKKRLREGTAFQNVKVTFRPTGSRIIMFPVGNNEERFIVLENLQLERILKIIEEKPQRSVWKIDGIYTEFRGENYVLLQRAVSVAD